MCVTVGLKIAHLEARSGIEPLWAALQAARVTWNQWFAYLLPHFDTFSALIQIGPQVGRSHLSPIATYRHSIPYCDDPASESSSERIAGFSESVLHKNRMSPCYTNAGCGHCCSGCCCARCRFLWDLGAGGHHDA